MRLKTFTLSLFYGGIGLFSFSCQQDMPELRSGARLKTDLVSNMTEEDALLAITAITPEESSISCSYDALSLPLTALSAGVTPSFCSPTALKQTLSSYLQQFGPTENQFYASYVTINHVSSLIDNTPQFFGGQGEHNETVSLRKAELEQFWNMPNLIRLQGQHNSTLNNRNKIAAVYMVYAGYPASLAYLVADRLLMINKISPVFVETPLLSYDAFATTNNMIVLGDGLIEILAESGVAPEAGVTGVLAHEWGHQVQYKNFLSWYGVERQKIVKTPELSRQLELEADFFTGYYLTHRQGSNKSWKQAADFFELFYQLGDCSFTANDHHGTPNQRMAASRLGFLVSIITSQAQLQADDVHDIFVASYHSILTDKMDRKTILASLKNARLKNIFLDILKQEQEVRSIANGSIAQDKIKDLKD